MSKFTFKPLMMPGAFMVHSERFEDPRGSFSELHNLDGFALANAFADVARTHPDIPLTFEQTNLSVSKKGVIRGLHIQRKNPQGKLVTCLQGTIFDVGVDLRADSPTFRRFFHVKLHQPNTAVYWPGGVAHGLMALEDSMVLYQCSTVYDKESDGGIYFADPALGIKWPDVGAPELVSAKDHALPTLDQWLSSQ